MGDGKLAVSKRPRQIQRSLKLGSQVKMARVDVGNAP